jgi:hypothetical protein
VRVSPKSDLCVETPAKTKSRIASFINLNLCSTSVQDKISFLFRSEMA